MILQAKRCLSAANRPVLAGALWVGIPVAVLVFGFSVIRPAGSTRSYAGTALVRLHFAAPATDEIPGHEEVPDPTDSFVRTECEVLRTERILREAIGALYPAEPAPIIQQRVERLARSLEVQPLPDTPLVRIHVRGHEHAEAARLANAVAEVYQEQQRAYAGRTPKPINGIEVEIVERAVPVEEPASRAGPARLLLAALGAALLGAVAAMVATWHGFRRGRVEAGASHYFLWVSSGVFSLIVGTAAVFTPERLAAFTAMALFVGLGSGAAAELLIGVRRVRPICGRPLTVVVMGCFVCLFTLPTLSRWFAPPYYSATVLLRLGLRTPELERDTSPQGALGLYDPRFLSTECGVLLSDDVLTKALRTTDLGKSIVQRFFDSADPGNEWLLATLRGMLDVAPLNDTSLIRVEAVANDPGEAARAANVVAERYCLYHAERASKGMTWGTPRVEIIQGAWTGRKVAAGGTAREYLENAWSAATYAGMAGMGVTFMAVVGRGRRRKPLLLKALLLAVLLVVLFAGGVSLFVSLGARRAQAYVRVLVEEPGGGLLESPSAVTRLCPPGVLERVCERIRSPHFLAGVPIPKAVDESEAKERLGEIHTDPVPNTSLIAIRFRAQHGADPALINATAEHYCAHASAGEVSPGFAGKVHAELLQKADAIGPRIEHRLLTASKSALGWMVAFGVGAIGYWLTLCRRVWKGSAFSHRSPPQKRSWAPDIFPMEN